MGRDIHIATWQLYYQNHGDPQNQVFVAFGDMGELLGLLVVVDTWRTEADRPHGHVSGCLVQPDRVVGDPGPRRQLAWGRGEANILIAVVDNLNPVLVEELLPEAAHAHQK